MTLSTMATQINEGRNVRRIREILGIKQDTLADKLGNGWNQQKISQLEAKEVIDPKILNEVAYALGVSPEAIKNFNEQSAINIVSNVFHDNSVAAATNCTFNPIETILKLHGEKEALLERIIKDKEEQLAVLKQDLLKNKK